MTDGRAVNDHFSVQDTKVQELLSRHSIESDTSARIYSNGSAHRFGLQSGELLDGNIHGVRWSYSAVSAQLGLDHSVELVGPQC